MRIRIVLADDTPVCLQKWVFLLKDKFDIVAAAADGLSALEAIRAFKPDVAILDLEMPGLSGIEVTRKALEEQPALAVLICSVSREPEMIEAAAEAKARGYVFKINLLRDLVNAVEAVTNGRTFFPECALALADR